MKVGLIGLGAMGSGMAANLYKAGQLDFVWNRSAERSDVFAQKYSTSIAVDLTELASQSDLIIISVSADNDLREVITAMQPALRAETIIIDTSTVAASTVRELAKQLEKQGVNLLDAPVSGGVEGARKGSLVMMVGGDKSALEKASPILEIITSKISWMGESGSGQATKAVNQIMAAGINQAVTEALAFAEAMQLPLDDVIDVISNGAAGNWFLQHRGSTMVKGEYASGFKIDLHKKDLDLCRKMVEAVSETDMRLPIVEMTRLHYERLQEAGYGAEDISALYRLKREMF